MTFPALEEFLQKLLIILVIILMFLKESSD
jgi:hypothetical protein